MLAGALLGSGYCGPSAQTAAVQHAFLRAHRTVALSDVMAIAVYNPGGYAQVMYQGSGVAADYWKWTAGMWRDRGAAAPASFAGTPQRYFDRMQNLRAAGGTQCANPHFAAKGSG